MTRISETQINTDQPERARELSWDRIPFLSNAKADRSGILSHEMPLGLATATLFSLIRVHPRFADPRHPRAGYISSTESPSRQKGLAVSQRSDNLLDERTIIIVTSLGHAVCHMGELAFSGVQQPIMRQFKLDQNQVAALGFLGYVLMGLGAVPAGLAADRWGPTRLFGLYFLAMAIACLTVVAAVDQWSLFGAFTAVGIAASIYHPVGVALLSLGVSPSARGRALGINGVAGSIGIAVGPSLGLWAESLGVGMWRWAYAVIALVSLLSGGLMLWAASRSRITGIERDTDTRPLSAGDASAPLRTSLLPLSLLLAAMMLGGLNYRMLATALPPFFSGSAELESAKKATAGVMVFITLIVGAVGQYGGGWLGDRLRAGRIYPFCIGGLAIAALLLSQTGGTMWALPVGCMTAVCLFASQPIENSLMAEWTATGRRSSWYGVKFALTFGFGALGLPLANWVWKESGTVDVVFLLLGVSAVVMGLLAVTALQIHRRRLAVSR
jgi:MFS family permease